MRHHFPWIAGTMIASAVYFQSTGVSRLPGGALIPDRAARLPAAPPVPPAPRDGLHATSAEPLLPGNPFDAATAPPLPPPGGDDDEHTPALGDDDDELPPAPGGDDDEPPPAPGGDDDEPPPALGGDDDEPPPAPGGGDDERAPAPGGAADEHTPSPDGDPWRRDPVCEAGRVVLIAVSDDAAWSFAAIEDPDGRTQIQRLGGRTPGGTLARITWDRVWLTAGGARCQMRLGGVRREEAPPEPQPRPQARPVGADAPPIPPEIAARVQRVSATEIHVDRATLDRILAQQADQLRSARVTPDRRGEQVVGMKLRLRRGSLLEALGLESGDSLRSINGFDVTDPQRALEAHAQLRSASHLSIAIERGGQLMTIDVDVR
ncbi:type II secretion system protein GspC [Sorangium sp. So ce1024]|uniref:type II secretion system protein GspC n=1 Tax=Sorangium sp. So ce1024 TaxID=3133327 RepID=UPI003F0BF5A3